MPVRSLNSVVFEWPRRDAVLTAARRWATTLKRARPEVQFVWCVGSCARGDYGVGSDLDVVVVIADCELSLIERQRAYEPRNIPVPTDLIVYTESEWDAMRTGSPHGYNRWSRERIDLLNKGG